jgi:hypothetical protein
MSKVKALLLAVSMVPFVLGAQNLVKNGDAESGLENWNQDQVQVVTENPHSGESCFKMTNQYGTIIGTAVIPVDGTKTYKYSCWFKSVDDKKATIYLGLSPMTADKKTITALQVNAMQGTDTALAVGCKPEDTVIKVKNASSWKFDDGSARIAFDTDDSGEYKDLPNENVTPSEITKIEKKDNVWEVTLKKPCGMAYAAETKVRAHHDGGYMYATHVKEFQSKDWKEVAAEIKGTMKSGAGGKQFWPGTKYVKLVVLAQGGGMIYFDDIQLEEVR